MTGYSVREFPAITIRFARLFSSVCQAGPGSAARDGVFLWGYGGAYARAYGNKGRIFFFSFPGTCPSAHAARLGAVPGYFQPARSSGTDRDWYRYLLVRSVLTSILRAVTTHFRDREGPGWRSCDMHYQLAQRTIASERTNCYGVCRYRSATASPLRFVLYGLRPSADALSLGLGLGLIGPRATQGPPKGHPSVTQGRPRGRLR